VGRLFLGRITLMSRRRNPEAQLQRTVVKHLRVRGVPGLVFFHVPNGGSRSPIEGAMFKGMGVRAGVSDLILAHNNKFFALELKAEGGRATAEQLGFLQDIDRAGAYTALASGLDAALRTLEAWGLLKPEVTMRGIYNNLDRVVNDGQD
jgi:hypothetical protein